MQEKVSQRCIQDVRKCKRRSDNVASTMSAKQHECYCPQPRPHHMLQDGITQTSRSHKKDEPTEDTCASAREDLTSQHSLCVQRHENVRMCAKQQGRYCPHPTPPHVHKMHTTTRAVFHPANTNLTVLQLTEMFEKQRPELTRILAACLKTTCPSVRWVSSR